MGKIDTDVHCSVECVTTDPSPLTICLDLDKYCNRGIKQLNITINEKEFIFTKDEIERIFRFLSPK